MSGEAHPALLLAQSVYEDHGERHAITADLYWRIGSTYVHAMRMEGAGTAYPIRANSSGIYLIEPHRCAQYTLRTEIGDVSLTRLAYENFDPAGNAVYTYYDYSQKTPVDESTPEGEVISDAEWGDLMKRFGAVPAVDFSPLPQFDGAQQGNRTGEALTWEQLRTAYEDRTLDAIDYRHLRGANVERVVEAGTWNYYARLPFVIEDFSYELRASYRVADDELEELYLWRSSDGDNLSIWRSPNAAWKISVEDQDAEGYISERALTAFLARATFAINEHVKLDLPAGYAIGEYRADIGWAGGAPILPQTYFPDPEDGFAPVEWTTAGSVQRMRTDFIDAAEQDPSFAFTFTNGIPSTTGLPMHNHTSRSEVELVFRQGGLSSAMPYLYFTENRDLYTAAGMGAYEERTGRALTEEECTSDYHVFVFPEEGADYWFVLELDARTFSETAAKAIAESAVVTMW